MSNSDQVIHLTAEQQQALNAGNGVAQGESFVLLRTDVVLDWFGYTQDDLRRELQPALEQVERGETAPWNLEEFLTEMRRRRAAKHD
jgi:hypothetical protein